MILWNMRQEKIMANIMIVEDDVSIHEMIKEYLNKQNENSVSAYSGTEALLQLQHNSIDIILLDLMLPGMHGEELIETIKTDYPNVSVIVVSAKNNLADKIELLNKGADDYVCKPFALEELYARIQVQLRKTYHALNEREISYKKMKLLNDHRTLLINKKEVILTRHEYRIMELLMTHPKQAFTKKEIYEYAWEDFYAADDKTINVHISNIRNKCTPDEIIETIWGIGFKMKA